MNELHHKSTLIFLRKLLSRTVPVPVRDNNFLKKISRELSKKKEKGTRIECETLRVSEKLSNQLIARESFCAQVPLETLTVLLFLFPQLLTYLLVSLVVHGQGGEYSPLHD